MPECIKCKKEIPDGALYCPWCGKKQSTTKKPAAKRGNRQGTAYKRGKTWTAMVVTGYEVIHGKDGESKRIARKKTKGGFATKAEALAACDSLRKKPKTYGKVPAFINVYNAWEKEYLTKGKSKSTLYGWRAAKKYYADLHYFGFNEIGLDDLQDCVNECPQGKRTRENMKALASLLYKYALPRHWSDMNYAEYIQVGEGEEGTHPPFDKKQVEIIRASIGIVPHAEDIFCLIYTGFRPTEFLGLTVEDVVEQDGISYLTAGIKTEAGKGRAVTIAPRIKEIIDQRLRSGNTYLFPRDDGERMTADYFRDMYFYPALAAMGIQQVPEKGKPAQYVPYSCRHTFSNMLKNAAGADKDKAALMGHADYETTKRLYQSAELENLQRITDQF